MHNASSTNKGDSAEVEVFYDGLCPLCSREITLLRRWDKYCRVQFTDIADPEFAPESVGRTMAQLMHEIHGRLPDGRWVVGVEVFRHIYEALGCHVFVRLSRLPVISHLMELGYRVFAPIRLRLAGGCDSTGRCKVTA